MLLTLNYTFYFTIVLYVHFKNTEKYFVLVHELFTVDNLVMCLERLLYILVYLWNTKLKQAERKELQMFRSTVDEKLKKYFSECFYCAENLSLFDGDELFRGMLLFHIQMRQKCFAFQYERIMFECVEHFIHWEMRTLL